MRALNRSFIVLLSLAPLVACRTARVEPESVDSSSPDLGSASEPLPIVRGEHIVTTRGCHGCHDDGHGLLAGGSMPVPGTRAFAPNLTPDGDTGIGDWKDSQLARAIREGLDDNGEPLCPAMPRYDDLNDDDVSAVIAYLRSLTPVRRSSPESICPPLKDDPDEDAAVPPVPSDAGVVDDAAPSAVDATMAADSATFDCRLRINEIQVSGPGGAADEFVELFNPCPNAMSLRDHWLLYRSAAGTHDVRLVQFGDVSLQSNAMLVCAPTGWPGAADCRYGDGLASSGGGLALWDGGGRMLDAVGWGSATNDYVIGHVAPAPPSGQSLSRVIDGVDSADNARDFHVTTPTPGAPNK